MAKFTMASAKSFIRKNNGKLMINVGSKFDGMTDGTVRCHDGFVKVVETNQHSEHTAGITGAWFVGGGRDYLTPTIVNDKVVGFGCFNCCGSFEIKIG